MVKKDVAQNTLYVSHGYDPETAYQQQFKVHDFHATTYCPEGLAQPTLPARVRFKIRHTPDYLPARLESTGEGSFILHADAKIHGVAPGQFCVIYDEHHHRCFGSGEITL